MNLKTSLEKELLGACLTENVFGEIAGILSYKNFSMPNLDEGIFIDHQEVFRVFEKLYPTSPINPHTVYKATGRNIQIVIQLIEYQKHVCSTIHLRHTVFMLLEESIRMAFIDMLNKFLQDVVSIETRGQVRSIINHALHDDILLIVSQAGEYLKKVDTNLADRVFEFERSIDRKVYDEIKLQAKLDTLLQNLQLYGNTQVDSAGQIALNHVKEIAKSIINVGTVSQNQLQLLMRYTLSSNFKSNPQTESTF